LLFKFSNLKAATQLGVVTISLSRQQLFLIKKKPNIYANDEKATLGM